MIKIFVFFIYVGLGFGYQLRRRIWYCMSDCRKLFFQFFIAFCVAFYCSFSWSIFFWSFLDSVFSVCRNFLLFILIDIIKVLQVLKVFNIFYRRGRDWVRYFENRDVGFILNFGGKWIFQIFFRVVVIEIRVTSFVIG